MNQAYSPDLACRIETDLQGYVQELTSSGRYDHARSPTIMQIVPGKLLILPEGEENANLLKKGSKVQNM